MTLREFQLGKFTLLALLAHLEYRDGIKLDIKPWEGIAGGNLRPPEEPATPL